MKFKKGSIYQIKRSGIGNGGIVVNFKFIYLNDKQIFILKHLQNKKLNMALYMPFTLEIDAWKNDLKNRNPELKEISNFCAKGQPYY